MDETLRALGDAFPLLAVLAVILLVVIAAVIWGRRSAADAARTRPFSADPDTFAQYSYGRIRERYLEALKQTGITHGLAIVLAIASVLLIAAGLLMLGDNWLVDRAQETAIAFLLAGAAVGALSAIAFIHATSDRRLLITTVETIRTDWKLQEAVRLAQHLGEPERTRLLTALTFHLSGAIMTQGMLRDIIAQRERAQAAATPAAAPSPTFFEWRAHFRRCGRRHGRRLVLERDYL